MTDSQLGCHFIPLFLQYWQLYTNIRIISNTDLKHNIMGKHWQISTVAILFRSLSHEIFLWSHRDINCWFAGGLFSLMTSWDCYTVMCLCVCVCFARIDWGDVCTLHAASSWRHLQMEKAQKVIILYIHLYLYCLFHNSLMFINTFSLQTHNDFTTLQYVVTVSDWHPS